MTVEEFKVEARKRFGEKARTWKYVCPMCGTIQSGQQVWDALINQNSGKEVEINTVLSSLGFCCIGRYTGQGDEGIAAHGRGEKWDKGCNWTLGGLLRLHTLEIVMPDGKRIPSFELAKPKE